MTPRIPLAAAAVVVAALAAAAPAPARLIAAESVMPPGNSGRLPQTGENPHLTDQIPLFEAFAFKPSTFGQPGALTTPRAGVRVRLELFGRGTWQQAVELGR